MFESGVKEPKDRVMSLKVYYEQDQSDKGY